MEGLSHCICFSIIISSSSSSSSIFLSRKSIIVFWLLISGHLPVCRTTPEHVFSSFSPQSRTTNQINFSLATGGWTGPCTGAASLSTILAPVGATLRYRPAANRTLVLPPIKGRAFFQLFDEAALRAGPTVGCPGVAHFRPGQMGGVSKPPFRMQEGQQRFLPQLIHLNAGSCSSAQMLQFSTFSAISIHMKSSLLTPRSQRQEI